MTACLRCGEKMYGKTSMHPHCVKHTFGTKYIPTVELEVNDIPDLTPPSEKTVSITDRQVSIPMNFHRKEKTLSRHGRKPGYTLRLPIPTLDGIPENQNLCMNIAERLKVPISRHTLVRLQWGTIALLTKRTDRVGGQKLHPKSFREILDKEDKHDGSLEEIGEKLKGISEIPGLDVQLLLEMILLSFIIGHSDLHLDKFSVLYEDKKKNVRLAPLEDIYCSQLFDSGENELNLPLGGKTSGFTGEDFRRFALGLGIHKKSYNKIFLRLFGGKRVISRIIKYSKLEMEDQLKLTDLINERFKRLM